MVDMHAQGGLPDPVEDSQFYDGVALRRAIAWFIDEALGWLIGFLIALAFGIATIGLGFLAFAPVMAGTAFLYRWLSLARWSATPAMALFGIQIRALNGDRLNAAESLVHTVIYYVCIMSGIGQIISIAMMAMSPMGRGAQDMLIGSAAINRPA